MQTETASKTERAWRSASGARTGPLVHLRDLRLSLILTLALLAGILAYQAPPASEVPIGWLGDRLFLDGSEGQGAADQQSFYGDEISAGARGGRSRWTRRDAAIRLSGLGPGGDLVLTLRAQGWPADALNSAVDQPQVEVQVNGTTVDRFKPALDWADYHVTIPASARANGDIELLLRASDTFTSTATVQDPRPKGIRMEYLAVRGAESTALFALPAPLPVWLLVLDGALCWFALIVVTRRPNLTFVLAVVVISAGAIGLALERAWAAALLPWVTAGLALLPIYARRAAIVRMFARLLHRYARGSALNYGLVTMAAAWLAYVAARASFTLKLPGLNAFRENFPDSLLYGLLGMGLLLLVVVLGREGLPRLSHTIVRTFGGRRGAAWVLAALLATWVGYEAAIVAGLPYVGHADYADNAVVARNLVTGRGWVVDYVTQFYQLYPGVTRHQETWPLLQPVWIAPFFALLGAESWVAKIPNLIFTTVLALMIYSAGARVWDRRVGLTAALVILTSHLFFKLVIYATSDLGFVVFSFGAIFLLYRATDHRPPTTDHRLPTAGGGEGERGRGGEGRLPTIDHRPPTTNDRQPAINEQRVIGDERQVTSADQSSILHPPSSILSGQMSDERRATSANQSSILHPPSSILYLLASAVLTGLMLLQKPASGGLIALGMGLWFLAWAWRGGRGEASLAGGEGVRTPNPWRARFFRLLNVGAWGTIALLILAPYLARNIELFGVPFYSTESRDAWVIEYTGVWDEIYKVYIPDFGLGVDGPPDRSWVLRWGFDGTLRKLVRQVAAVRDYVAPPWQGLPLGLSAWLTPAREDKDTRLLFGMGAWLALFGALGVLRARRRLGALLLAAFVPYLLFLVGYWHANEERYFVMIMPWLALLASYALWGIYDRIALIGDGRWTPVGLALALSALVLVVQPSWPEIAKKVQQEPRLYAADIDAYNWLRANTGPGDVMMTRLPWQLNWHSQRPAVMIPYTSDPNVFLRLARYYKARYLVLDSLQRPKEEVRAMLDALIENSDPRARFELVYATTYQATDGQGRPIALTTEVYRFPESYGDVAELRP